ncbi:MAG: hypothetical protein COA79_02330 [Planctomycetota bacterium]|nr:MAG: hypothetical protein COA79_02330 [Planctomycetota bacterium]
MIEFDQIDFLPKEYIYLSQKSLRIKYRVIIGIVLFQLFLIPFYLLYGHSNETAAKLKQDYRDLKISIDKRRELLDNQKRTQSINESLIYLSKINDHPIYDNLLKNYLDGFHKETWIRTISINIPLEKKNIKINVSGSAILKHREATKQLNKNIQIYRGKIQSTEQIIIDNHAVSKVQWESH